MSETPLNLRLGESELRFVPSVHYRIAFAEEVNALCREPASRPDAMAVELGPRLAAAARAWMVELRIGHGERTRLPCMLGLMKDNRYLRPSMRERAQRLQRETVQELQALPPEVLYRELGYAKARIVPLSPTDSIVEAMRCALELSVPLYGVDLDDMADFPMEPPTLEDPTTARGEVTRYVTANAPQVDRCAEREVTPRRETVMAARLKAIATRHRRVMVVCGLAHWRRLVALLQDTSLRPATRDVQPVATIANEELADIRRVVIDPGIACRHMDLFPAVVAAYERARAHPLLAGGGKPPNCSALMGRVLRRACRSYFAGDGARSSTAPLTRDLEALRGLEGLLQSYALVNLRRVPDLSMIMTCARSMMSDGFCEALLSALMAFPWAKPEKFKRAATIVDASEPSDDVPIVTVTAPEGSVPERIVYATAPGGDGKRRSPKLKWGWAGPPRPATWFGLGGFTFTWTPWENLVTAMCLRAIGMARKRQRKPYPEPFAGQMLDGIDLKATLRAFARGEDRLYIRNTGPVSAASTNPPAEGFPVVWIFDAGAEGDGTWHTYHEYVEWFLPFARFPERLEQLARQRGNHIAEVICFGDDAAVEENDLSVTSVRCDKMRGLLIFAPLFSATRQYAKWFEGTDLQLAPAFTVPGVGQVPSGLMERCERLGMRVHEMTWQDRLVALALTAAPRTVTVVAPKGFLVGQDVVRLASRRGQQIAMLPLEMFPADLICRMTLSHMVSGTYDAKDGTANYDEEQTALIGEPRDRYRALVPPGLLSFGMT